MAADMYIHALVGAGIKDYIEIEANTIGSKFFGGWNDERNTYNPETETKLWWTKEAELTKLYDMSLEKFYETPQIWIGEVSWLKATLFEGGEEKYILSPIMKISELIGEKFPILTDELASQILAALDLPRVDLNYYKVCSKEDLAKWLEQWKGARLVTINW